MVEIILVYESVFILSNNYYCIVTIDSWVGILLQQPPRKYKRQNSPCNADFLWKIYTKQKDTEYLKK